MVWGTLIVWYLFLAGVAAGAYLTSAFVEIRYPENKKIKKAGRLLTPVLLAVGLLFLMLDAEAGLHNPLRFFALVSNPGSVMTLGVYVIIVFMVLAIISAILELMGKKTPKIITGIGVVFAVGLAVYTGFLLGVVQAYPLWNNAALPVLFLISALSTGLSATSLLGLLFDRKNLKSMSLLKNSHAILLGIEILVLAMMLIVVGSSGNAATDSVLMIVSGSLAPVFWIGVVVVGLVVPLALELISIKLAKKNEASTAFTGIALITELGVLVGGFMLRFILVTGALPLTYL